jgi:nitrite reductase (NADH) small subunit
LGEGTLHGDTLTCPYHGWAWNVRTGACVAPDRPARVAVYPAHVEAGEVWVELP